MHAKRLVVKVIVLVAGTCAYGLASAQSVMQPGGWEVRTKVSAQHPTTGKSSVVNESVSRMCISSAFLAKEPYLTPGIDKKKMEARRADCSISDAQRNGNSASWKMSCRLADGSNMAMSIRNTASRHKLTSNVEQTIRKDGRTVLVGMAMDWTYIGACTDEMLRM